MPIPTYTSGYPPDGSSLGQTKSVIRNNLDGTFQTLGIDHINNNGAPGSQPAGYHNVIHIVPQGSNPAATTGYGQLYSKTINSVTTDEALFWETGNGLIQQLTANLTPTAGTNGYTFLPGGFILQWGIVSSPGASGTVTFATSNIAFPNNCYNVQLELQIAVAVGQNVYLTATPSNTSFAWSIPTGAGSATAIFWVAIGN